MANQEGKEQYGGREGGKLGLLWQRVQKGAQMGLSVFNPQGLEVPADCANSAEVHVTSGLRIRDGAGFRDGVTSNMDASARHTNKRWRGAQDQVHRRGAIRMFGGSGDHRHRDPTHISHMARERETLPIELDPKRGCQRETSSGVNKNPASQMLFVPFRPPLWGRKKANERNSDTVNDMAVEPREMELLVRVRLLYTG